MGIAAWAFPAHAQAPGPNARHPHFVVDPSWPQPLPAPKGDDRIAHTWVQGEVAGSCIDANDNVYTFNRGWEVGVTVNGVTQGAQSGAINGQDAIASAIPSPPIVVFNPDGRTIAGWGNPRLYPASKPYYGYASYLPQGAHGCFIDYQGYIWLGGNGDGIVQKYNPHSAAAAGEAATYVTQIGVKAHCDGTQTNPDNPFTSCGEANSLNSSHTLLNEPADMTVDPEPDPVTHTRGSVYIADGYGNHRVVVFTTSDGGQTYQYNRQWGQACTINGQPTSSQACPPGTFGATGGGHPHCIVLGNDGLVYVCDRPNSRIQAFDRSCGSASVGGSQPMCFPRKIINIGRSAGVTPPPGTVGNHAFDGIPAGARKAIELAGTRGDDIDFWPNIDPLATKSPTSQHVMVDVDLGNDNTWLFDKLTWTVFDALGVCGIMPCPGHNAGHFGFGHTVSVDSQGNIYVAETITGRRIQKFVPSKR
jgi:hypothetical protein